MKRHSYNAASNSKKNLKKYNLTPEQYVELAEAQNYCCAICGTPETRERDGKVSALAVDHDHECCPGASSCGECIRGLLCFRCNVGIGYFYDNPTIMEKAAQYIREWYA